MRHKAHLDVELIELTRRAVRARIFVAKTRGDLEITVKARDHEQLFKLLRRLRQGVKFAGVQARRHEEVACAFRAGRCQDGRLKFGETLLDHPTAERVDDLPAQNNVIVQRLAAQIEIAMLEADFFGIFLLAKDRQWQWVGLALDEEFSGAQFNLACGQLCVDGFCIAGEDFADDGDDTFRWATLGSFVKFRVRIDDNLADPVMIAQIDEQRIGMFTFTVDPAGELGC